MGQAAQKPLRPGRLLAKQVIVAQFQIGRYRANRKWMGRPWVMLVLRLALPAPPIGNAGVVFRLPRRTSGGDLRVITSFSRMPTTEATPTNRGILAFKMQIPNIRRGRGRSRSRKEAGGGRIGLFHRDLSELLAPASPDMHGIGAPIPEGHCHACVRLAAFILHLCWCADP
jgi:hypothetical protein